jgi:hypothetical protein
MKGLDSRKAEDSASAPVPQVGLQPRQKLNVVMKVQTFASRVTRSNRAWDLFIDSHYGLT